MVEQASNLLMTYTDAMGGADRCEAAVLDVHFNAIRTLLETPPEDAHIASKVLRHLETVVQQRVSRAQKAA
jgi:hypothetical protein